MVNYVYKGYCLIELSLRDRSLFIAWGLRSFLGWTRRNLADPPFKCYITEVIPPQHCWQLSWSSPHVFAHIFSFSGVYSVFFDIQVEKRKGLFHEDHTPKTFASDELKYFQEALERVKVLYEEFQKASNMLTTTHINLKRKFPSRFGRDKQSRRKKENKRKVKKNKGEEIIAEGIYASRENLPQER